MQGTVPGGPSAVSGDVGAQGIISAGEGRWKDWAQEGGSMVPEHTERSAWDMEGLGDPAALSVGERRHKFRLAGRWLGCGCMRASH